MELRCGTWILHGVVEDGTIEVSCKSRRCGKRPGIVILHRFDLNTGKMLGTRRFQNPPTERGEINGTSSSSTTVRSA